MQESKPNKLSTINIIPYHKVSRERIIKKEITQCYNYQYLRHTAQNCNLIYKCVKCQKQHNPVECKIEKGEKINNQKYFVIIVRILDTRHHIRNVQNLYKLEIKLKKI
jgi:hypothetical protein